jgi:hypothetical protein
VRTPRPSYRGAERHVRSTARGSGRESGAAGARRRDRCSRDPHRRSGDCQLNRGRLRFAWGRACLRGMTREYRSKRARTRRREEGSECSPGDCGVSASKVDTSSGGWRSQTGEIPKAWGNLGIQRGAKGLNTNYPEYRSSWPYSTLALPRWARRPRRSGFVAPESSRPAARSTGCAPGVRRHRRRLPMPPAAFVRARRGSFCSRIRRLRARSDSAGKLADMGEMVVRTGGAGRRAGADWGEQPDPAAASAPG